MDYLGCIEDLQRLENDPGIPGLVMLFKCAVPAACDPETARAVHDWVLLAAMVRAAGDGEKYYRFLASMLAHIKILSERGPIDIPDKLTDNIRRMMN